MLQPYQEQITELVDMVEQKVKEFTASKSEIDSTEDPLISQVMLEGAQDYVEAMDKDVVGLRERFARRSYIKRNQMLVARGRATSKCQGTVGAGPRSYRKSCYIGTRKSKEIVPEAAEKRAQPLHLTQQR